MQQCTSCIHTEVGFSFAFMPSVLSRKQLPLKLKQCWPWKVIAKGHEIRTLKKHRLQCEQQMILLEIVLVWLCVVNSSYLFSVFQYVCLVFHTWTLKTPSISTWKLQVLPAILPGSTERMEADVAAATRQPYILMKIVGAFSSCMVNCTIKRWMMIRECEFQRLSRKWRKNTWNTLALASCEIYVSDMWFGWKKSAVKGIASQQFAANKRPRPVFLENYEDLKESWHDFDGVYY